MPITTQAIQVLVAMATLGFLAIASGAVVLILRRKQEVEDFFGAEEEKDRTTYVPYQFVHEAQQVLGRLVQHASLRSYAPFVVRVCRKSLAKARAGQVADILPLAELEGHVDWVTAKLYSHLVDTMAAAMIANVPLTLKDKGHIRAVKLPAAQPSPEDKKAEDHKAAPVVAPAKVKIEQMTVQERADVRHVLSVVRQGPAMLLLHLRCTEDERMIFLRAVERTARVHGGRVLGMGKKQYLVTSGIPVDLSAYVRQESP
jgi:SepF-like predicted cell division protein (DUF552 family)